MVRDCKRYVKYGGPCSGLAVSQRGSLFIVEGPCGGVGLMRLRPWPRQLCHHFAVRCGRLRCGVAGAAGVAFLWAWVAPRGGPWRSCCVVVRSRSRALRRGRLDSLRPSVLESTRCVCVCFLGHPLLGFAQPRGRCVLATPLFLSRRLAALAFSWWRASAPSLCCSLLHRPVLGVALFFSRCFWRLWPPLGATSFCSRCPWRPWPPLGSAPLLLRCVCGRGPLLVLRPSSRAARRP